MFSLDKFLIISGDQKNVYIRSDDGTQNYTISVFNINAAFVSGNLVRIKQLGTDQIITIPFRNVVEANGALKKLQDQIDVVRTKTPFILEKGMQNYVDSKFVSDLSPIYATLSVYQDNFDDIYGTISNIYGTLSDSYVTGLSFSGGVLSLGQTGVGQTFTASIPDTFVTELNLVGNTLTLSQNQGQLPLSVTISGSDTYTTGATLSNTDIIFTRNDLATYSVDLSNLGKKYNKMLFVDLTYGNDSIAEGNNIYRPFLTIASALTTAVSGDLIVLNPGSYNETITLKDGVDFYAYPDVIITGIPLSDSGQITDGGVNVTCNIYGYMSLILSTSLVSRNCIRLSASGTNVNFELLDIIRSNNSSNAIFSTAGGIIKISARDISSTGSTNNNAITIIPPIGFSSNQHFINCDSITGQQYAINCREEARVVINVKYDVKTVGSTGQFAGTITTHTLSATGARVEINCRNIINETTTSYACLFNTGTHNGNLFINCDTMQSTNTSLNGPATGPYGGVITYFRQGGNGTNWYINAKKILADGCLCIQGSNGFSSEIVINSDYIYSRQNTPIRWACTAKLKVYNVTIERGSGSDNTRVVSLGNTGLGSFQNAQTNSIPVLFENCIFKKTGLVTDVSTAPIFALDGANSTTIIRNCRVIGTNLTASVVAFYADTTAEGNIYFTNTYSQRDNTNITDISQVSGFVYDQNLIDI